MSRRGVGLAAASALASGSLIAILFADPAPNCLFDLGDLVRLFLLPALFSFALIWIMSEPIAMFLRGIISRVFAARLAAVSLALAIHLSIGTVGWAIFPDVPEVQDPGPNAAAWIPFWIVGVLNKAGHYTYFLCQ